MENRWIHFVHWFHLIVLDRISFNHLICAVKFNPFDMREPNWVPPDKKRRENLIFCQSSVGVCVFQLIFMFYTFRTKQKLKMWINKKEKNEKNNKKRKKNQKIYRLRLNYCWMFHFPFLFFSASIFFPPRFVGMWFWMWCALTQVFLFSFLTRDTLMIFALYHETWKMLTLNQFPWTFSKRKK